jgi:hypothetical protein
MILILTDTEESTTDLVIDLLVFSGKNSFVFIEK